MLGTTFALAPAAHADCIMIGHLDLGDAPALLHNPASQGNCNGSLRMHRPVEGRDVGRIVSARRPAGSTI